MTIYELFIIIITIREYILCYFYISSSACLGKGLKIKNNTDAQEKFVEDSVVYIISHK